MQFPLIIISTNLEIFELHLNILIGDFNNKYPNQQVSTSKINHKNIACNFAINKLNENLNKTQIIHIGDIQAIRVNDTTVEIRSAIVYKDGKFLGRDFFNSFFEKVSDNWNKRIVPGLEEGYRYEPVHSIEFLLQKKYQLDKLFGGQFVSGDERRGKYEPNTVLGIAKGKEHRQEFSEDEFEIINQYRQEVRTLLPALPPNEDNEPEINPNQKTNSVHDLSNEPWNQIPEKSWDRIALEFWYKGYLAKEIATKVNNQTNSRIIGKSVTNKISALRQMYGEEIVPKNEERKRLLWKYK
jgi:hypothetical protein